MDTQRPQGAAEQIADAHRARHRHQPEVCEAAVARQCDAPSADGLAANLQCPKIIAPTVKKAVAIQIATAALRSEMNDFFAILMITGTQATSSWARKERPFGDHELRSQGLRLRSLLDLSSKPWYLYTTFGL